MTNTETLATLLLALGMLGGCTDEPSPRRYDPDLDRDRILKVARNEPDLNGQRSVRRPLNEAEIDVLLDRMRAAKEAERKEVAKR